MDREPNRSEEPSVFKYDIEKYIEDLEADGYGAPHILTPFGKRLAELAEIEDGSCILDVGMGAGTSLFPAAEKVGTTGFVIGIDISEEMVKYTYEKIRKYGLNNAHVLRADARTLIFKDNSFDYVLSGFSYTFSTLDEIRRVLKKGGRFGLSTWKTLDDIEWMAQCLRKYMDIDSKEVYNQETPEELKTLLDKAGFTNITVSTETQTFYYADEEQWWTERSDSGWEEYMKKVEDMGPGTLDELKKEAFQKLQEYKQPHGIPFSASAHFAFGTK